MRRLLPACSSVLRRDPSADRGNEKTRCQPIFTGLPDKAVVGHYHSLHAERATFPAALEPMAQTQDGVIMAVRPRTQPVKAVQFPPESIMSARDDHGLRLVANVLDPLALPAN
ncbi:MAG: hypothetical protein FJX68_17000 [Alphaproteobacteria bacterium]|nr:hypothetical protein [Alphaproteobacteria bacterium]